MCVFFFIDQRVFLVVGVFPAVLGVIIEDSTVKQIAVSVGL